MSKHQRREEPLKPRGKRYEIFVDNQDGELEYLTLTHLIDLAEAPPTDIPSEQLVGLACRIYDSRRVRVRFFDSSMLGEPVWDMLLALYCLPSRGRHPSVTGLCYAGGVPLTTGLRWVRLMEQKGLIVRRPDHRDARRVYLMLSDRGEELMTAYMSAIYRALTTA